MNKYYLAIICIAKVKKNVKKRVIKEIYIKSCNDNVDLPIWQDDMDGLFYIKKCSGNKKCNKKKVQWFDLIRIIYVNFSCKFR